MKPRARTALFCVALAALAACRDVTLVLKDPEERLVLPVRIEDLRAEKYGIWPFGVHGGGHPEGHGGFDFELEAGATVRAAADGIVLRVEESRSFPGQWDVSLRHDALALRTSYGHLHDVPKGIVRGALLRAGDALGHPAWREDEGFSMIHFAVTDPRSDAPFGEVCPLPHFRKADAAALEAYWARLGADRKSVFEPALCNERVLASQSGKDPLIGSWFARRPRVRAHPLILTLTEFDDGGDGRRVFFSTEFDGRMSEGRYRLLGGEIEFVSNGGGAAAERRLRFRVEDGVLVLSAGGESTSYDRRFRSVDARDGE
jgi:hypothetical protein